MTSILLLETGGITDDDMGGDRGLDKSLLLVTCTLLLVTGGKTDGEIESLVDTTCSVDATLGVETLDTIKVGVGAMLDAILGVGAMLEADITNEGVPVRELDLVAETGGMRDSDCMVTGGRVV